MTERRYICAEPTCRRFGITTRVAPVAVHTPDGIRHANTYAWPNDITCAACHQPMMHDQTIRAAT